MVQRWGRNMIGILFRVNVLRNIQKRNISIIAAFGKIGNLEGDFYVKSALIMGFFI